MTELRAPDPTLSQMGSGSIVYITPDEDGPRRAHLAVMGGQCDAQLYHPERATDACWFAVPCRDCFPDAPPPGKEFYVRIGSGKDRKRTRDTRSGRGLAWQVTA